MERLRLDGWRIEGFPDAVKVAAIKGPSALKLAHYVLHLQDLQFAHECVVTLRDNPPQAPIVREALWHSAIIHYVKCFGKNNSRSMLPRAKIYDAGPSRVAFNYFHDLRNKHVAHDENAYSQALPGAIIAAEGKSYKIEKIVCTGFTAQTLVEANITNLCSLIEVALSWIEHQIDEICAELTKELEAEDYSALLSRPDMTYRAPTLDELGSKRQQD